MRTILRRARYGYLLALHVLLLCAAGRNPTEIAAFLFCSRSSIYRSVRLYRAQKLACTVDAEGQFRGPVRTTILMPWLQRSLGALLKVPPRTYGWCRTRWSCATLVAQLKAKHGLEVSAWTVRRWLHDMGWVWKRAKLVAQDNDPQRVVYLYRAGNAVACKTGIMPPFHHHGRGQRDGIPPLFLPVGAVGSALAVLHVTCCLAQSS